MTTPGPILLLLGLATTIAACDSDSPASSSAAITQPDQRSSSLGTNGATTTLPPPAPQVTSPTTTPAETTTPTTRLPAVADPPLPVEAYPTSWSYFGHPGDVEYLVNVVPGFLESVTDCVERRGVTFDASELIADHRERHRRRDPDGFGETYGYGFFLLQVSRISLDDPFFGDPAPIDPAADMPDESAAAHDRCLTRHRRGLDEAIAAPVAAFNAAVALTEQLDAEDPEHVAAERAWSICMGEAGHEIADDDRIQECWSPSCPTLVRSTGVCRPTTSSRPMSSARSSGSRPTSSPPISTVKRCPGSTTRSDASN